MSHFTDAGFKEDQILTVTCDGNVPAGTQVVLQFDDHSNIPIFNILNGVVDICGDDWTYIPLDDLASLPLNSTTESTTESLTESLTEQVKELREEIQGLREDVDALFKENVKLREKLDELEGD